MEVSVKFFAIYRETVGQTQIQMEVDDGSTLGSLLDMVYDEHPKLRKWADSIVCSVNRKYAERDKVLEDGDEVALLPPVSGGARMSEEDFRAEELLSSLKTDSSGAVVLFVGVVRKDPGVETLTVESYPGMAEKKLEEIIRSSQEKFNIEKMDILHRTGELEVGENIVLIGASASHRKDAFAACSWAIDELKKVVPIWKKDEGGWIGQDD